MFISILSKNILFAHLFVTKYLLHACSVVISVSSCYQSCRHYDIFSLFLVLLHALIFPQIIILVYALILHVLQCFCITFNFAVSQVILKGSVLKYIYM